MSLENGQDKITNISIHDGAVHISVIPGENEGKEAVKEEKPTPDVSSLFTTRAGFKVLDDGTWIAWYTNSYEDNEGEIFAEKAIAADIDRMNEDGEFPELWFWHVKGTKHGQAIAAAKVGRFAVAVGEFDDTRLAKAFKAYYQVVGDMALSHGFFYEPEDKIDGVFEAYQTFEISVLPPESAANPYTAYSLKETKEMGEVSEKVRAALIEALGKEATDQLIASGKAATLTLDQSGVAFKADKPDSGEDEEMDAKAMLSKMMETMSKMEKRLSEMEKGADTKPEDDDKPEDDKPEDEEEEEAGKSRSEQAENPINKKLVQIIADAMAHKEVSYEDKEITATPADSLWNTLMEPRK